MHTENEARIEEMLNELDKADSLYKPSPFWVELNRVHLKHLVKSGINNFKRSIGIKYFSWGILGIIRHQTSPLIKAIKNFNINAFINAKFNNYDIYLGKKSRNFNIVTSRIYSSYVACLFDYVSQNDTQKVLQNIEEPLEGNPFLINYKGRSISQDLCNSVHEFNTINDNVILGNSFNIAELGPGYGRLGYIFIKVFPNAKYCFIDIPPALFVSENYISSIFPDKKIFKFRNFESFDVVKQEFEDSEIRFLMPHQLQLIPDNYFNLFINISSLHEMNRQQIANYISLINLKTNGFFYTKQWLKSRTRDNNNITEKEYPIPSHWINTFRRSPHPIQKMFFDALYKINN
jgi:putative sugar O-methyltransferase